MPLMLLLALAQNPLTLDEAIRLAQDRGHQAHQALVTRDAARLRHDAFGARLLPQITLGGTVPTYNRSIIPVVQPDGSTLFRPQEQTNATLTATLSQRLPVTGGELFIASSLARLNVSGQQTVETWSSTPVLIGLRQNLLRPNTSAWDRREQSVRTEREERAFREAMEDVALTTTELFFDVYAARIALANAAANVAVNDTLYRINTGRYQVGRIGENDLLQSELAQLRAQTSLEGAQLTWERAVSALRLALRLPADAAVEVVAPDAVPVVRATPERAVTEALRHRSDVTEWSLQEVQADRRVTEARLTNGVGATIQASVGFNATAPEMALAYRELLEARQFTLAVQVPLWQWGAHGATVQAAELDRERVASQSEAAREQLAHEARFAVLQLEQARRNVELLTKADSVANARFTVAYNRYVIGRITIDNLFTAQAEKDQGVTQLVQARRAYWQAFYRLRRLTLFDWVEGTPIR
jgi:outer membrane protein TolC